MRPPAASDEDDGPTSSPEAGGGPGAAAQIVAFAAVALAGGLWVIGGPDDTHGDQGGLVLMAMLGAVVPACIASIILATVAIRSEGRPRDGGRGAVALSLAFVALALVIAYLGGLITPILEDPD